MNLLSEASGFLEVPLVLPLDSTEKQIHNHAITKVRDTQIIFPVVERILKNPNLHFDVMF